MTEPAPNSTKQEPGQAPVSYWGSVWARLAKNPIARWGLYCIAAMVLLAVGAPLVSLNQPFVWATEDGVRFPWFAALFNRLLFESSVDILFNASLATAPLFLGYAWWSKRGRGSWPKGFVSRLTRVFLLVQVVFVVVAGPETFFGAQNPLHHTEPVINYRVQFEELKSAGKEVTAIFPLRTFSYRETNPQASVLPPSGKHWLGTDTEGRDVFARMLYGLRISLTIGVVAVVLYVSIGVCLGALAGYFGGWVDNLVSRAIEVMICFPTFFLILTLAALIEERSIFHVMIIIGLTSWTGVARLTRAEFLKQRSQEYAQAALVLGLKKHRIIFRHILPNAIAPVLVTATFGVASAVLIESSLSFLGIGDTTVASWGETLNAGRLEQKLWLVLAPGFAIFFVVSVFNLVGEGLRDALDPKLKS